MLHGAKTVLSPAILMEGKVIATGMDDGSVYVWDVQDGRKIRQVMLNSVPRGPISCLNWIGEDPNSAFVGPKKVCHTSWLIKDLDVDFDVTQYFPRVKAIGRKYLRH